MEVSDHAVFNDTTEFLEIFQFGADPEDPYHDPIVFQDRKVGFSIKRKYPNDLRFKPPMNRHEDPDKVAGIWVGYLHPDEAKSRGLPSHTGRGIPVTVRISTFSKYLSNHFDYNDDDDDSPTGEEVAASNRTPEPIGLEFMNDFFFDHEHQRFVDIKGKVFSPRELLDHAYELHCHTVHHFKGLALRIKLAGKGKLTGILTLLIDLLIWVLKQFFGRTLEKSDRIGSYYKGYEPEDFKRLKEDTIDIFGYRAGRSTVIVFCIIVLAVGLCAYPSGYTSGMISYVSASNTMLVAATIVSLACLDLLVPLLLIGVLNIVIRARTALMFMQFKIRR